MNAAFPLSGSLQPRTKRAASALLAGTLFFSGIGTAVAQDSAVDEYGEVPGVEGVAKAVVTVDPGNYATLIAVARVAGGKLVGEGTIPRAGTGVDLYVDDEICTADRDMRRGLQGGVFTGSFATSATCMTILGPGSHTILAEKVSVNVEGAKMTLKYTILGGKPDKTSVPTQ